MADKAKGGDSPVTIKKYANRRLYNTSTSSYVTLDHLCEMVKEGIEFTVFDAKTGEDITRSVLTQIIVEEEGKGTNLLPISFLRQLIAFYGDSMHHMLLPQYLEHSMRTFTDNRERLRSYMQETVGNMFPFGSIEEMGKQNVAMFEQAVRMFSPFGNEEKEDATREKMGAANAGGPQSSVSAADVKALQSQLDALRQQLDAMKSQKS